MKAGWWGLLLWPGHTGDTRGAPVALPLPPSEVWICSSGCSWQSDHLSVCVGAALMSFPFMAPQDFLICWQRPSLNSFRRTHSLTRAAALHKDACITSASVFYYYGLSVSYRITMKVIYVLLSLVKPSMGRVWGWLQVRLVTGWRFSFFLLVSPSHLNSFSLPQGVKTSGRYRPGPLLWPDINNNYLFGITAQPWFNRWRRGLTPC